MSALHALYINIRYPLLLGKRNYFVDDTVLLCLCSTHEEIAVGIALNTFKRLSSMLMDNVIDLIGSGQRES